MTTHRPVFVYTESPLAHKKCMGQTYRYDPSERGQDDECREAGWEYGPKRRDGFFVFETNHYLAIPPLRTCGQSTGDRTLTSALAQYLNAATRQGPLQ